MLCENDNVISCRKSLQTFVNEIKIFSSVFHLICKLKFHNNENSCKEKCKNKRKHAANRKENWFQENIRSNKEKTRKMCSTVDEICI